MATQVFSGYTINSTSNLQYVKPNPSSTTTQANYYQVDKDVIAGASVDGITPLNDYTSHVTLYSPIVFHLKLQEGYKFPSGITTSNYYEYVFIGADYNQFTSYKNTKMTDLTVTDNELTVTLTYSGSNTFSSGNLYYAVRNSALEVVTPTTLTVTSNLSNCTSSDVSSIVAGTETTITLTANSGYHFSIAPTVVEGETTHTFTISDDYQTATLTFTPSADFTINGTATETVYYDFTNRLTGSENCTVSGISNVIVGTPLNITITPNAGYEISGTPYLQNSVGNWNFTVNSDGTATFSGTITDDDYNSVFIRGTIQESISYLNVTKSLTNCTSSDVSSIVAGTETTITLTANSGYGFSTAPTVVEGETTHTFTISDDYQTATLTFTPSADFTINGTATEKITFKYTGDTDLVTISLEPSTVFVGSTFTATITPLDGYELSTSPYIQSNTATLYNFTIGTDGIATFTGSFDTDENEMTIHVSASEKQVQPTTNAGFIRVFTPSDDVLDRLSNYSLINPTTGDTVDLTKYIYGLYHLFAPLTPTGTSNIFLSRNDTNISSEYYDGSHIYVESEEVELPSTYNNVYDYEPFTTSKIYLPFIGYIDTDTNVLKAGKLKIRYDFNLLNMDTLATVLVDGVEMYRGEGKCGYNIPFNLGQYSFNTGEFDVNGYIFDLVPKVVLVHSTPYDNGSSIDGKNISKHIELLSSLSGLNSVTNVKFATNSQMLDSEKEELVNLLASGVYF